jgi:hypothetical protein
MAAVVLIKNALFAHLTQLYLLGDNYIAKLVLKFLRQTSLLVNLLP